MFFRELNVMKLISEEKKEGENEFDVVNLVFNYPLSLIPYYELKIKRILRTYTYEARFETCAIFSMIIKTS